MFSIKTMFARAASGASRISLFALALICLAIDDDRQDREKDKRRKRERPATPPRRGAGPAP